ncbi:MAG: hypothetical protein MJZ61_00045 [Bacteroidales bacterium]|nr:hypothetical protein [Bacteroidales bacterium]
MKNKLYSKEEVIEFIKQGRIMHLCGSEAMLEGLPKGNWIAGMTPYFMDTVGKICENKIYVEDFSLIAEEVKIAEFDETNIHEIAKNNTYKNGFILMILPLESPVYYTFSNHSLEYENIYDNPVVGYVSSCLLEDYGKVRPKVSTGANPELSDEKAVAMYVKVSDKLRVRAEIMNFDTIDYSTPALKFPKTSFNQSDCLIDGKPGNIAQYLEEVKAKIGHYPQLITSQNGALVNRDIKTVDVNKGVASYFSPAYENDEHYTVKPNANYLRAFNDNLKKKTDVIACFSCTSYFLLGDFEYQHIDYNGVYTFGEIGYQLLNKTIVTLEFDLAQN